MPSFLTLLHRSNITWDIIVLTECWLQSAKYIPNIENYNFVSSTVHKTQNEGVTIFYNKKLNITSEEPPVLDANCLIIKIDTETCIIGIYRPPSHTDISNFLHSLDITLSKLNHFKNIILCGDINIDILPHTADKRSYEYLNVLASHSILPGHTLSTHGRTCLDHIMIKTKLEATCLVMDTTITDHESVAISIRRIAHLEYSNKPTTRIDYVGLDKAMQEINFESISDFSDVDLATDQLVDYLSTAVRTNTKTITIAKRKRISKPWISIGLLRCMRNRDNLYKKLKKDPKNETLKLTYRRYRNYCNSLLKKSKRTYEKKEIDEAGGNNKKLWNAIKKISGSYGVKDDPSCLLVTDNPKTSVNNVNNYFSGIGKKLAEQIDSSGHDGELQFDDSIVSSPVNSFVMLPTDEEEIIQLIKSLKDNCAIGLDQVSGKILKRYMFLVASPITHICNLSISTGVFPRAFKSALIKPIHKTGDRSCVNNYRPISIFTALSKIMEKLMNLRLITFLESNHLLSSSQFGFRRGKSTNDAVNGLLNCIITNLDEGKKCLTVFLDLAKAFDTVSVPLLLLKLEGIGIRGLPLRLFTSYLTSRTQQVKILNWLSDKESVSYGVPQGSILGPTLFLIYINSLCGLQMRKGKIFSFADDTALFFSESSWDQVFELAQTGFGKVSQWLQRHLLTLNVSKTKYMAFAFKSNHLPPTINTITAHNCTAGISSCSCPLLQRTDSIKYLGVVIDQSLSFKPHVEVLVPRLRKLIYIFRTLRHLADRRVTKMVYYALCQSLLAYCITSWGGAAKTHVIEVERAQRAILKVGAGLPYRHPTVDLFKKWDVLTVRQTFIIHIVLKKHAELEYDPLITRGKRRKGKVCKLTTFRTSHSHKFYCYLGAFLYNKLNTILNLYSLCKLSCKKTVSDYLKTLDYEATEKLLKSRI